jgi:hypothetical protein
MDVTQLQGVVRTPIGAPVCQPAYNERSEQICAEGLPLYTEMTRRGNGWSTMSTAAVASLVVRPGVLAGFEIFNGYGGGGKSLVIDRMFAFNLVSTNVIESFSLWAQVTAAKSAVTSGSFVVRGLSGKGYTGPVICAASTTVVDCGWFPWGQGFTKGAGGVLPMGVISVNVEGRLIVPPQSSLCLHTVASLVGDTCTMGASWYEEQLSLE